MLEDFHWHFQAVQWQNLSYEDALANLGQDEVFWHFDFKQNVSIPQGPSEGGAWWYANARLEFTVFGLMEARRTSTGVRRCYYTVLSLRPDCTVWWCHVKFIKGLNISRHETLRVHRDPEPHRHQTVSIPRGVCASFVTKPYESIGIRTIIATKLYKFILALSHMLFFPTRAHSTTTHRKLPAPFE